LYFYGHTLTIIVAFGRCIYSNNDNRSSWWHY